jgi:hypothetical protein
MFSSVTSYLISAHTSFDCYVLARWEIQFPWFFFRRIFEKAIWTEYLFTILTADDITTAIAASNPFTEVHTFYFFY